MLDALGFLIIISVFFGLPPLLLLYGLIIFATRGIEETIRPAPSKLIHFDDEKPVAEFKKAA